MTKLKLRNEIHIARKIYHLIGVLLMIVVYHNIDRNTALLILSISACVIVPFDFLRQKIPFLNKMALFTFRWIMRENELKSLAGTTYLIIGTYLLIFFFPRPVATLSLLFLAVGDPIASAFGIWYGKDKLIGFKTLQGTIACFICCWIIALFYFLDRSLMTDRLMLTSLIAGFIGALAELIPIGNLDDNLTLPLISATLLSGLFKLFGGL